MPSRRNRRDPSPTLSGSQILHTNPSFPQPIVIHVQPFNPKLHQFPAWFRKFKNASNANVWDEAKQLTVLPALFPDSDQDFFENLPNYSTVADIYAHFSQKYKPLQEEDLSWVLLQQRFQKKNESIDSFSHNLLELAKKALPHLSETARKHFIKNNLVHQCRPSIRKAILTSAIDEPLTFDRALKCARLAEVNQMLLTGRPQSYTYFNTEHSDSDDDSTVNAQDESDTIIKKLSPIPDNDPKAIASTSVSKTNNSNEKSLGEKFEELKTDLNTTLAALNSTLVSIQSSNSTSRYPHAVTCNFCGKPGHKANVCRSRSQQWRMNNCEKCGRSGHSTQNCRVKTNTFQSNGIKCFKCGRNGHKANSCRSDLFQIPGSNSNVTPTSSSN